MMASLMDTLMTAQKVAEIGFQMVDEMGIQMDVLIDDKMAEYMDTFMDE